jgi:iron-sulfur cluster repair protein YtfE (RIC family)
MSRAQTLIDQIPAALVSDPVAWFFLEHERHRRFCALMDQAAAARDFDADTLAYLLDFLRNELARHIIDEEEDLFPLLRRRALPDDAIDEVLRRLSAEHRADADHAHQVRDQLEVCLKARKAPSQVAGAERAMHDFASQELRHLALENAVVLPIARLRLTPPDLKRLSRRLAERRGLTPATA